MTFRWYGEDDSVTLENIKQIPNVTGVVSAIYDIPVGEVWPIERIQELKKVIHNAGLELEVIESVPVHEDIKLKRNDYQRYIDNYKETIRNLAKCGIKCICYNFMPVFDWTRSSIDHQLADGSYALVYYKEEVDQLDPTKLSLPGWDASYSVEEVSELIEAYKIQGEEGLWENLQYFIEEILPVASACDVNMAIHPDDPPWSIFGSFEESAHYSSCGSLDMVELMKAYIETGFEGYIRPDHGRMIWGEKGKPGYGLYDRALGAMYLGGIIDALKGK